MTLLESVQGPADLKRLEHGELVELAAEIRSFLIEKVSRTGGHLGPNLGAVELTLAVHRVFDSPRDAVVFDTGHQAYVHKIVTGRQEGFDRLRKRDGLSGYPSRAESEHDLVENSHASTSLSYADGLARSFQLTGGGRHAVAIVGDGALTGGMCWEALNNIAADQERPLVIIVNDNGRSYAPTIGGFAEHLSALRLNPGYEKALERGRSTLRNLPVVGRPLYTGLHAAKSGLKDAFSPQVMFSDLGIKYLGPVDGHDMKAMEQALAMARSFGGPVIVHAVTRKGNGFAPAENHEADQMHQVKVINPETGLPTSPTPKSWTNVFSDELVRIGGERSDVVAMTAAMLGPTGLDKFAKAYPDRCFDVGIAEQHAMTSAAGMAMGGLHPVFAVYSTFLNRAFDQLLMDVALHRQPVTVTLDRSGITGDDGASHNGMWDMSILGLIPGIRVAAPRDAVTLREELREAVAVDDGPTVVRFSKGSVIEEVPALERVGGVDVLHRPDGGERSDVLLAVVGAFGETAVAAARRLAAQGIGVTVVDPRWVTPVPQQVVTMAAEHELVVTLEDGGRHGGFGWALAAALRDAGVDVPLRDLAVPNEFLQHASREQVLADLGLTEQDVARRVTEWVADRLRDQQQVAELDGPARREA
ncbi:MULTISPECIES: 1-deoxy-D-xylulose-5-phosphate synthase [unclassified Saccharopolyspora]|uniref:1-deoxy-D-xylulose-5-phosphate synthase n=1 Tax=unclassified Saccharopolyspora TaxID=2646250 RepID=UPI001CD30727|nr:MULTISPECIES: 1-deoxy-D-xylulose-5-phosphate synthase [unclassified Saccharopolyspora]MCA1186113.1 1-deoxy-D-xylulose-5-phosphate synthase [Saccharopolyspora sp. 6T]MCA1193127.1 1-deoxy-D-xylulose-5-phosphate synthase [Saccharopolyspora sp. 6V]MCA1224568.1 1-deoxy-D-xylulose-5-phosphate synthase [Saccharopolyspora sp. 6M]MCA1279039.1 1-deoxy-D-xylulose-5-phosphate synthase [Saccharopolyspora sp. 7B]